MQQKVDKILKGLESGQITPEEAYSYIYENEKYKDTDKSENNKDIAIIGFACRFPDAESSDKLWLNIIKGSAAIKNIPEDRWKLDEELKKRGVKPFASMCRYGGFIDGVDLFDANFFEITEEEAVAMDPQHRLLLEAVMEGIEYSGYSREGLWGSRTGIFIGARGGDYKQGFDNNYQNARAALTGTLGNFNSARISNFFNFKGPSLVFDTACSSSLVSTHYACKSILNHECDMAVAGGVHLCINADTFISLNLMPRSLASNGVSYTFDKRADGFVPGEGVGVVILKSLTKAVEDGDTVYAVIKGSAVNNDGNTIGVTTPDLDAQQEVVEMALKAASVDAATISYIEAHGTGTMIGDPIEIRAIDKAFKKYTDNKSFCALGTVKPNIGHLDTAAGIASIIKVVLSLYNKKIPPTLNIEMPNPRINFVDSPFYPAAYLSDWNPVGGVRRAGISSFGFGGTNCHMILEEAPAQVKSTEEFEDRKEQLFLLSAKSQEALKKLAENYSVYLSKNTQLKLGDICFTAGTSRTSFKNRLAVLCSSTSELSQKLGSMEVLTGDGLAASHKVAFMFTGQGAQYSGMALELYENQPIF
ncbi:6-deoxyerythronolide-B synthase, partial [Ruminiclostridium papyrosolvens DSM 2782]